MMQIDKIITEANLRDVKVFHFDTMLDGISIDIDNFRKLTKRHNIEDTKGLSVLLNKEQQLQELARQWIEAVGLHTHRANRIIILIEEEAAE